MIGFVCAEEIDVDLNVRELKKDLIWGKSYL
jgi:hypothetical protein